MAAHQVTQFLVIQKEGSRRGQAIARGVFFTLLFIKGIYNHWAINKIRDAQIMKLFIKRLN